jgi:hypothetical protein
VVLAKGRALAQLCAAADGASLFTPPRAEDTPHGCDEGQLYRCGAGAVTACRDNAVVARCVRGCVDEGAAVDDDVPVTREAAFAILCSR